jgi:carbamoyl-phosphate synthase large subunit
MVRPSFVIGGVAMRLCFNEQDLEEIVELAFSAEKGQSVLIDRFLQGREFEVDALCDGESVFLPGIFEHLEPAGIHSGDSMALFPDMSLTDGQRREIVETVQALSASLGVKGLMNVQFVLNEGRLYVIEANPRASRTVPIASKLTGLPLVEMAVRLACGQSFSDLAITEGLLDHQGPRGVKVPVFSTEKLPGVDAQGGVRMQSTGESLGLGDNFGVALVEALAGAGWTLPARGRVLFSLADKAKHQAPALAAAFSALGWEVEATKGTATLLERWGLKVTVAAKGDDLVEAMADRRWDLVVNVPGDHPETISDGFRLRRAAVESSTLCLHTVETASALAVALAATAGSVRKKGL